MNGKETGGLSRNNLSRVLFKEFLIDNDFERVDRRNVFIKDDMLWAYCILDKNNKIRQFYEDCVGIYTAGVYVTRDQMSIGTVTRVTNKGLKARTAHVPSKVIAEKLLAKYGG